MVPSMSLVLLPPSSWKVLWSRTVPATDPFAEIAGCKVSSDDSDVTARKQRVVKAASSLAEEIAAVAEVRATDVAWVEGPPHAPRLKVAPLDVGEALAPSISEAVRE